MFIGKWNKSVILTYIGLGFSILGMNFAFNGKIEYSLSCLIIAGICDLFDGKIARSMKRDEEEKLFGIELDSMADVSNFVIFPITIFLGLKLDSYTHLLVYVFFAICGIARLAYFNISAKTQYKSYYQGLPVTYTALILPVSYLLSYFIDKNLFKLIFLLILISIGSFNIIDIKIPKPKKLSYVFFSVIAIIFLFLYLIVL